MHSLPRLCLCRITPYPRPQAQPLRLYLFVWQENADARARALTRSKAKEANQRKLIRRRRRVQKNTDQIAEEHLGWIDHMHTPGFMSDIAARVSATCHAHPRDLPAILKLLAPNSGDGDEPHLTPDGERMAMLVASTIGPCLEAGHKRVKLSSSTLCYTMAFNAATRDLLSNQWLRETAAKIEVEPHALLAPFKRAVREAAAEALVTSVPPPSSGPAAEVVEQDEPRYRADRFREEYIQRVRYGLCAAAPLPRASSSTLVSSCLVSHHACC